MAAKTSQLGALHELLCKTLQDKLTAAAASEEGIPAALVKEIREFLKDNGIEADPDAGGALGALAKEASRLPFQSDDAVAH